MRNSDTGQFLKTHDMSHSKEYGIWGNMLYRCNTITSPNYPIYGGRGISVCSRWNSFENFISDMKSRPDDSYSLDRVDVNGDYSPENCRWATPKQQSRNRTNSMVIFVDGEGMQVDDYCEKFGLGKHAIRNRIRRGWSSERIVNTPIKRHSK